VNNATPHDKVIRKTTVVYLLHSY